tara:strand:- start:2006 stop:3793 length:1788 start_codon:yes stop_codon:yes gene_type:complete
MPLLSNKDYRNLMNQTGAMDFSPSPTFGETVGAAFSFTRDEGLSTSSFMNNEGYAIRREQMNKLKEEGFDVSKYIDDTGAVNYDNLSSATGLVKSDLQIFTERNELLEKRRNESEDVMARGSGFAQFLGMTSGYMTDPVNVASLPFGGVGTAVKGMSVLSRALIGARNASAVAIASEAAIQPLVYKHKHDIGSPYEVSDAIQAIAFTAIGAGVLGGAAGGISGYLAKTAESTAPVFAPVFPQAPLAYKSPMIAGRPAGAQTFENIGKFKEELITEAKAKLIGPAGQKLTRGEEKKLRGELSNLEFDLAKAKKPPTKIKARKDEPARVAKQKVLQGEVKRLEENIARTQKLLDDSQATREYNKAIIRLEEGKLTPELQQQLDDYINIPSTPETQAVFVLAKMAESMRLRKGFRASELALESYSKYSAKLINSLDEAKDVAVKAIDDEIAKTDVTNTAKIDDLNNVRNRLTDQSAIDRDGLDSIFEDLFQKNIDRDVAMLRADEAFRVQMDAPTLSYNDYIGPARPKAAKASTTPMQRQDLSDKGLDEAYDSDMALFNQLETKMAIVDGELVDAAPIMKELNDELEGLDSVMRCAIG